MLDGAGQDFLLLGTKLFGLVLRANQIAQEIIDECPVVRTVFELQRIENQLEYPAAALRTLTAAGTNKNLAATVLVEEGAARLRSRAHRPRQ
ncbi:hypothetical protein ACOJBO_08195 [Rhizobium beringeri]